MRRYAASSLVDAEGGEFIDELDGFEGDGDDLADEADDAFGVVEAVGVIDDAGAR